MMKSKKINKLFCLVVFGIAVTAGVLATSCGKKDYTHDGPVNQEAVSKIGFYETYKMREIYDALIELNEKTKESADSLTFAELTGFMALAESQKESPVIGSVKAEDSAAVDTIIARYGPQCLPADLKLAWTAKPEVNDQGEAFSQLIALRMIQGLPAMTGESIVEAKSVFDDKTGYSIGLRLNDEGARMFSKITAQNINWAIAIVVDGKVISYPIVNCQIDGGILQIPGNFTEEEAMNVVDFIYDMDTLKL